MILEQNFIYLIIKEYNAGYENGFDVHSFLADLT